MSDFKAKMHHIRFRLGLCPRPAGGAYSAADPLTGFKGILLREDRGKGRVGGMENREDGDLIQGVKGDRRPYWGL